MFVYLHANRHTLLQRMRNRGGHFMPTSLLDSQLATLERPEGDENSIEVDVEMSQAEVISAILRNVEKKHENVTNVD